MAEMILGPGVGTILRELAVAGDLLVAVALLGEETGGFKGRHCAVWSSLSCLVGWFGLGNTFSLS